jgi:ribosomal protein S18 acetylase RimI-like enzyme
MADALAEVELLAVDAEERRRGVGSELLRVGEEMLRGRGVRAVLVKVLEDDVAVMKWYSERGYRVLSSGEVFALRGGFGVVGLQNEDDGYRLGIKQLV